MQNKEQVNNYAKKTNKKTKKPILGVGLWRLEIYYISKEKYRDIHTCLLTGSLGVMRETAVWMERRCVCVCDCV